MLLTPAQLNALKAIRKDLETLHSTLETTYRTVLNKKAAAEKEMVDTAQAVVNAVIEFSQPASDVSNITPKYLELKSAVEQLPRVKTDWDQAIAEIKANAKVAAASVQLFTSLSSKINNFKQDIKKSPDALGEQLQRDLSNIDAIFLSISNDLKEIFETLKNTGEKLNTLNAGTVNGLEKLRQMSEAKKVVKQDSYGKGIAHTLNGKTNNMPAPPTSPLVNEMARMRLNS